MYSSEDKMLRWTENEEVSCACGCGQRFDLLDRAGRPRRFAPGHRLREGA